MPTPTQTTTTTRSGLKVKTHVKAGGIDHQHNETLVRIQKPTQGLKVKTHVKAGVGRDCQSAQCPTNHNETLVRPAGLKVKTSIKAGMAQKMWHPTD